MADLTVTAASVVPAATPTPSYAQGTLGETVTAGQAILLNSSNLYVKADNDAANLKTLGGVALNGGAINQPVKLQTSGDINLGVTLVVGTLYCLSSTAGGICPFADLNTGDRIILIGIGKTTSLLQLFPAGAANTGVDVP